MVQASLPSVQISMATQIFRQSIYYNFVVHLIGFERNFQLIVVGFCILQDCHISIDIIHQLQLRRKTGEEPLGEREELWRVDVVTAVPVVELANFRIFFEEFLPKTYTKFQPLSSLTISPRPLPPNFDLPHRSADEFGVTQRVDCQASEQQENDT